jgi:hypothetical protein
LVLSSTSSMTALFSHDGDNLTPHAPLISTTVYHSIH